jgi:hypothetical protein
MVFYQLEENSFLIVEFLEKNIHPSFMDHNLIRKHMKHCHLFQQWSEFQIR